MTLAIRYPFSIGPTGYVTSTTDASVLMVQRALAVIGSRVGERMMQSDFGSGVPEHIFSNDLNYVNGVPPETVIANEATTALARWAPDLRVVYVEVVQSTASDGAYDINVRFTDGANDITTSIVVNRDLLTGVSGS